MSLNDKSALVISIISLMVSALAVIVPYYQNEKQFEEQIVTYLKDSCVANEEIKINGYFMIKIPYHYRISNNGNITSSITALSVSELSQDKQTQTFANVGELIDSNKNNVRLPININSGESKLYTIYIPIVINKEISDKLISLKKMNKKITCEMAENFLGQDGKDFFNNRVSVKTYEGNMHYIRTCEEIKNNPTVFVKAHTAKGNIITAKNTIYECDLLK